MNEITMSHDDTLQPTQVNLEIICPSKCWIIIVFHFDISDPYVKVWLMFGDKRVEKKKTPVYKCNLNPIFNATFEFDVPWEQIRDCALDVTVMDFDTVGRNELIGKLILGCKQLYSNLTLISSNIYYFSIFCCFFSILLINWYFS